MTEFQKRGFELDKTSGLYKTLEFSDKPYNRVYTEKASDRVAPDELPAMIFPSFWAMTADTLTRNSTRYPKSELMGSKENVSGIYSWVTPYEVPVIKNHDEYESDVYGRIVCSRMVTSKGVSYLNLIPRITDKTAIEKVLKGEFYTLSIGVNVEDAKCSICGQMLMSQGFCEHYKGDSYTVSLRSGKTESRLCYYDMYGIRGREISFVNVPSDKNAHVNMSDMGEEAVNKLIKSSNTASASESSKSFWNFAPTIKKEHKNTLCDKTSVFYSQNESFESETFSKDFLKNKGFNVMSKSTETTESDKLTETQLETKTETAELTDPVNLPDLSSLDKIKEAVTSLIELDNSGKEVDVKLVEAVQEAYNASGLSESHLVRLELSDVLGVALFDSKEFENLKEFFTSESQETVTESILAEKLSSFLQEKSELQSKVEALEKTLSESENAQSLVLSQSKVSELETQLSAEKDASKSLLVSVVASEMVRTGHRLATSKTTEELHELLSTRSRDSLLDTYSDLSLEVSVKVPEVVNPLTQKSELSITGQLSAMLKKKSTESEPVTEVKLTEELDGKIELKFDDKGNLTVTPIETDESDPIVKRVRETTLNLSDLV